MKWLHAVIGLVLLLAIGGTLVSGPSRADLVRYRYLPGRKRIAGRSIATGRPGTLRVNSLGESGRRSRRSSLAGNGAAARVRGAELGKADVPALAAGTARLDGATNRGGRRGGT